MLEVKLRVQKFCETIVKKKVDDGGFAFVDAATGTILFYGGPSADVIGLIIDQEGPFLENKYPPN